MLFPRVLAFLNKFKKSQISSIAMAFPEMPGFSPIA
jgi:hypothetical protein